MVLFNFLFLLVLSFSANVVAGIEKNCSNSFQAEKHSSNGLSSQNGQNKSKGPQKAEPHLSLTTLLEVFNSSSSIVARKEAVQKSLFLNKYQTLIILERALDDPSPEVRKIVVQVAVSIGEEALNIMNRAFENSSPEVQQELVRSATIISTRLLTILKKEYSLEIGFKIVE